MEHNRNYPNHFCFQFWNYTIAVTDTAGCVGYDTTLVSIIAPNNYCLRHSDMYLGIVLLLSVSGNCSPCLLTVQNGILGYWPFCGNANDESGNGNDGTVNGATLTSDRFGNSNSAYESDGIHDPYSNSIKQ